ncbi:hypothetical protein, partial [Duncaniella muris]|uniref:hypothetical protein n=1 Tax=Duncaniella muris TaxID=2094150 RepID=UPI00272C2B68
RCHGLRVNLRPPDAHPVSARATWPDRSAGGNTSEKADSGWLRNQQVPDKADPDDPWLSGVLPDTDLLIAPDTAAHCA